MAERISSWSCHLKRKVTSIKILTEGASYEKALNRNDNRPTLLVEVSDYYNEK